MVVHPTFWGVHHNVFYEKAILNKFESLKTKIHYEIFRRYKSYHTIQHRLSFFPLIINALGGYTWEANLKDTFTFGRIVTGVVLSILGYRLYLKKQKA